MYTYASTYIMLCCKTFSLITECNKHQPERIAQWPSASPLHQTLYGGLEDLWTTTNFITAAGLVV